MTSAERESVLNTVVLPVVAAVAALALLIVGPLEYSIARSDALARERQVNLVASAVRQSVAQVAINQEGWTLWDEAVVRIRRRPLDYTWIDSNLGVWFYTHYQHDEVYILDGDDQPVYAMQEGLRTQPEFFARISAETMPFVQELRLAKRLGPALRPTEDTTVTGIADLASVAGRPAIVSIRPFLSDSGDILQTPGEEHLHISVRYLDGNFLQRLRNELGVANAHFTREAKGAALFPLQASAGKSIGYLAWTPFEPARLVQKRLLPMIAFALLLAGLILGATLHKVRRSRMAGQPHSKTPAEDGRSEQGGLLVHGRSSSQGLPAGGDGKVRQDAADMDVNLWSADPMLARKPDELRAQWLAARASYATLTIREREIARLIAQGHSSKQVARVLDCSPRTVDVHRGNLMAKLEAHSVADVVRTAIYAELAENLGDIHEGHVSDGPADAASKAVSYTPAE